jgi:hypothetical protein
MVQSPQRSFVAVTYLSQSQGYENLELRQVSNDGRANADLRPVYSILKLRVTNRDAERLGYASAVFRNAICEMRYGKMWISFHHLQTNNFKQFSDTKTNLALFRGCLCSLILRKKKSSSLTS